ncbi:glycosyltransferase family 4 protein [Massilia sp. W12]|uniref:glycosyltransferase family 4 protein n=1 Tax=Massilia sp. W12 TaxID=3126507 RepID=UPI0030D60F45
MKKRIVMLGTSFETLGGISSVVKVWRAAGLLSRWGVLYLETHRDGSKWRKISYFARAWLGFMWQLLTFRVALAHVHLSSGPSFWRKLFFMLPAIWLRVPLVVHLHGGRFAEFYDKDCGARGKALIRYVYDHAAAVIVLSNTWLGWAKTITNNPRIYALYNPVQVPPQVPFASRKPQQILFLGRVGPPKGSVELMRACAELAKEFPQLELVMGGDGDHDAARALAAELGIADRLKLPGWIVGADKQKLLDQAAIFALPSYFEGLPMSVLEAMASGLPIVASTVGGIPEAVTDQQQGFLVPPRQVAPLQQALHRLLADAKLREQMGQAAHQRICDVFATEQILPQVERIYYELGVRP